MTPSTVTQRLNMDTQITSLKSMVVQILRFLIRCGAHVDEPDLSGNRPLHYACRTGDVGIIGILVDESGVDVFAKNKRGKFPESV